MDTKTIRRGKYTYHIKHVLDENPDLSFLGVYSNSPGPEPFIDRQERGEQGRGTYRYFQHGCGDPDYIEQDYARMEAYNRGEWYMMGVTVEISVKTKTNWATDPIVARASLWGIESDSEASYFEQVEKELMHDARIDLKATKEALE